MPQSAIPIEKTARIAPFETFLWFVADLRGQSAPEHRLPATAAGRSRPEAVLRSTSSRTAAPAC